MSLAFFDDSAAVPSLLDLLLAEQRSLPAVETFARRHLAGESSPSSKVYEQTIPLDRPLQPGQQLAFQVDLDACTGCKACVTACHSMNGLAAEETWREVGLVVGRDGSDSVQQTVTTTCHHCEDPACLAGCPVQAYEKDVVTGIVRHLDDQCIGCQYCVLKCPYDVPKYSEELKIVRKCDMCTGRLAVGESPACVQGCPNGAITIEIVDPIGVGATPELLSGLNGFVPDSAYTRPTTRYVSARGAASLRPADLDRVEPAQAHDPLAAMLVLLQMSVGTLAVGCFVWTFGTLPVFAQSMALSFSALTAVLGLCAATLHLGRPLYAFRAFLGWRTSWMSREIIVVGVYVPAIVMAAITAVVTGSIETISILLPLALAVGALATVCSMMIYVDTHRRAWALSRTVPLFSGTLLGLGSLVVAVAVACDAWVEGQASEIGPPALLLAGMSVLLLKLGLEAWQLAKPKAYADVALARGVRLMRGPLLRRVAVRFAFALGGLLFGCFSWVLSGTQELGIAFVFALATLLLFASGEFVERHLYFTAEASPAMPGR